MLQFKTHTLAGVAITALSLGLASCATNAPHTANPNEIVIGVAGPMSGDLAAFGEQERWGVKTAVADINAAGGLLGKQLRVEIGDDQCDPRRAVSTAQDMVADHAALVVGHFCSGSSIPASEIYASSHIIQITPSSTNPMLTDQGASRGWTTLFRTGGRDDRQGVFAAKWFMKAYANRKIAVLSDGSGYGQGVVDKFLSTLSSGGVTPVFSGTYRQKSSDFSDIVTSLKNAQPHVVYIGGYHNDFALILRQARAAGITADFVGVDALNTAEFVSIGGTAATDGVRFSDESSDLDKPYAAKVVAEIRSQGYEPEGYTLASYAAVQAWAAGVTRAGTTDSAKVAAAMRAAPVDTVRGTLSWDAKGDIQQSHYAWFIWQNGRYAQEPAY